MKKFMCVTCSKEILDFPSSNRKYCSRKCLPQGYMHTEKSREKMSEKAKKRIGEKNNFFGKTHTEETKKKMRERKLENPTRYWIGKKRPDVTLRCKGKWQTEHEDATYGTKHERVRKMWGTPKKCELCGDTNKKLYDWSNKDHKYRIERSDWQRLCRSCHIKWDKVLQTKLKEGLLAGEKLIKEIEANIK